MATEPEKTETAEGPSEGYKFEPVKLEKGGAHRTARTATQETELRFNGWRNAPAEKAQPTEAETTGTPAPKPAAKPAAPKN